MALDLALCAVVIVVLAFHVIQSKDWAAERRHLINAAIADTPAELIALDRTPRKAQPAAEPRHEPVGL